MCEKVPDYVIGPTNDTRIDRLIKIRLNIESLEYEMKYNDFVDDETAASYLIDACHSLDNAFEEVAAAIQVEKQNMTGRV